MSEELERITVLLQARDAELQKTMDRAVKKVMAATRQMEKSTSAATRGINQRLNEAAGSAAGFGKAFIGGLAVGAITTALAAITTGVRGTIADIADMVDAADRIGFSAEQFQAMQFGMQQAGVSADQFSSGMEKLSDNIGDAARGSTAFGALMAKNNIALTNTDGSIRATTDVLADFADLLERTPDAAARMSLVTEAFGRGGKAMVLALSEGSAGLEKMQEDAREAGVVLSETVARQAAVLDDRFERLTTRVKTFFAELAIGSAGTAVNMFDGVAAGVEGIVAATDGLTELEYANQALADTAAKAADAIGNEAGAINDANFAAIAELIADISSRMQGLVSEFEKGNISAEEFALQIAEDKAKAEALFATIDGLNGLDLGPAKAVLASLGSALVALGAQANDTARAVWNAAMMGRNPPGGMTAPRSGPDFERGGRSGSAPGVYLAPPKTLDDFITEAVDVGTSGGGGSSGGISDAQRDAARWFEETRTEAEKYATEVAELNLLLGEGLITQDTFNRGLEQTKEKYLEVGDAAAFLKDINTDLKDAFLDAAMTGENGFDDVAKAIKRAALEAAPFGSGPLAGIFGGKGGGILSSVFSGIAGARANGGPVSGGSSYLVGERGPELFTPSVSGAIVPNSKMGGGSLTVQPMIATISMSDDGSVSGTVKVMVRQGSEQAVATSRRSLPAWQAEYARTGGLV